MGGCEAASGVAAGIAARFGGARRGAMSAPRPTRVGALALALAALLAPPAPGLAGQEDAGYEKGTRGTRWLEGARGTTIKVLVEPSNLGGEEVSVAEITFPPGPAAPAGHRHATIEIFYIRSGVLDHVVNGESHILEPGMVGVVRTGDSVIHRVVGDEPVEALVIWVPGSEVERIAPFFEQRPVEPPPGR